MYCNEDSYEYETTCYGVPSALFESHYNEPTFFLSGSYTLWQPSQDNLALAVVNLENPEVSLEPVRGWIYPQMTYQSGFTASAGINTFHDSWKLYGIYTYYHHSPSIYRNELDNTNYTYWSPFFSSYSNTGRYLLQNRIDSKWKIALQKIDVLFDRNFFIGKQVLLAPIIGLTGCYDKQDLYIESENEEPENQRWESYQTCYAIGPTIGIDLNYFLFNTLGFCLKNSASILYSNYYTRILSIRYEQNVNPSNLADVDIINYSAYKPIDTQLLLQSAIGLKYEFNRIDYGVSIHLLWDFLVFFDHNKTSPYVVNTNNNEFQTDNRHNINYDVIGNFYLQGLTVGGALAF